MKRVYFVTGATGTVGSALIPFLLEDADNEVRVLIRADGPAHLEARLEELYEFWGYGHVANERQRIQAIAGDVEKPGFGVSSGVYENLSNTVTHIIHCAGKVRMNLPLEDARSAAVASARNVVELGRACKNLKKIEFVSTVGVGGRLPGAVPETWITTPRDFHNTYEQSKAEAEDYIRAEVERGLPLTVHRPSMVVGDATTGKIIHFQIFYYLCEFLSGRPTRGVCPILGRAKLDIIPADYVGRVLCWSSMEPRMAGRILHLCSGPSESIPLHDLQGRVRHVWQERGLTLPKLISIPPGILRAFLPILTCLVPAKSRRALRALPIFLDYLSDTQAFANHETKQLLVSADIDVPQVASYLNKLFGYYFEKATSK